MRIVDYPEATKILPDQKFLVDGPNGTHTVSGSLILENSGSIMTNDPYIVHRNTYRGASLGSSYTDEQKEAISSGSFDELYAGDYWEINGVKWRVMDFDYFNSEEHHVVIWPDSITQRAVFHTGNLTSVGYRNSAIRIAGLRTASGNTNAQINSAFGTGHQLIYKDFLSSTFRDDGVVGTELVDASLELPNTYMIYGTVPASLYYSVLEDHTNYRRQFAALAMNPKLILASSGYWFRNARNDAALILNGDGCMVFNNVASEHNVRPIFALKG